MRLLPLLVIFLVPLLMLCQEVFAQQKTQKIVLSSWEQWTLAHWPGYFAKQEVKEAIKSYKKHQHSTVAKSKYAFLTAAIYQVSKAKKSKKYPQVFQSEKVFFDSLHQSIRHRGDDYYKKGKHKEAVYYYTRLIEFFKDTTQEYRELVLPKTANSGSKDLKESGRALASCRMLDFAVPGKVPTATEDIRRQFFLLKNKSGNAEVIWQDQRNRKIFVSHFDHDFREVAHHELPSPEGARLLAATNDEQGNYYYAVFKNYPGRIEQGSNSDVLILCKADPNRQRLVQQAQNSAPEDFNIFSMSDDGGVMAYHQDTVAMFMAKTMHKSSDGLNHQQGICFTFDANTLNIINAPTQTSSHCFDNLLMVNRSGEFVGADLGDNYPRGINLHKFRGNSPRESRVVYTFKTQHGMKPQNPAGQTFPSYGIINDARHKFYKWSNDNKTYSEIGGVAEVKDGYLVIFSGEPDQNGKSLNNARAKQWPDNDARNLGIVKVRKDYENATTLQEAILSKGMLEKGGFYAFNGSWEEQINYGINWLTHFKDGRNQNVKHIKVLSLPGDRTLVLFAVGNLGNAEEEQHAKSYMMILDAAGKVVVPAALLDEKVVLNRRDEVLLIGKQVVIAQGWYDEKNGDTLRLHLLEVK